MVGYLNFVYQFLRKTQRDLNWYDMAEILRNGLGETVEE